MQHDTRLLEEREQHMRQLEVSKEGCGLLEVSAGKGVVKVVGQ